MSRLVELRAIAYDTATVRAGDRQTAFFLDRREIGTDATSWSERSLVHWITTQQGPRRILLEVLGLSPRTATEHRVRHPFLDQHELKPGDIDLLLCDPAGPHRAVAVECKRVRVRAGEHGGQRVNRLEQIRDAPAQTNGLRRVGFNQTYLGVIVIAHDLSDSRYNFAFRGTRETTFSEIIAFVEELPLDPEVGILYLEVAQPLEASIRESGVVYVGVIRPAVPVEQPHDLTTKVDRFFASRGSRATPKLPDELSAGDDRAQR